MSFQSGTIRAFAMSVVAVMLGGLCAVPWSAGQEKSSAKPGLDAITSTDGVLQIRYPQFLLRCEHLDAENPDVWTPESGCVASIPVCDSSGHAGNVLSCVGYPLTEFQGSELQAAALSVSRLDSFTTERECLGNWASKSTTGVHAESIHGVVFRAAQAVETEASHVADHYIYRTFHKGACYELDVNIAVALDSAFAAEDAPRKLTQAEREKIKAALTQALDGFRFLK